MKKFVAKERGTLHKKTNIEALKMICYNREIKRKDTKEKTKVEQEKGIMKNKSFLYITAFFAGMSIMAVELAASRLLAPYFSSSQIIWTIIIGIIMISLAIGNILGGRMADKNPNPGRLYFRLLIGAIWISVIPFAGKYIIAGVSVATAVVVTKGFLAWAALFSCIVIFAFPLILLGIVTPSLVKYSTDSLKDNGRIVGMLGGLNTIGSIIGTFLPTFVTIPSIGTAMTFIVFAALLAIISCIYFFSVKKHRGICAVALIVTAVMAICSAGSSFAFWEKDVKYESESIYNYLKVQETSDSIQLSTNVAVGVQSIKMKEEGLTGMYYDYAMAAPLMAGGRQKEKIKILILGMGTGTYAAQCLKYFDNVDTEGVEIDKKIIDISRKYFDLPREVKVAEDDGRAFLRNCGKYDVIMVDAYQDITIPFQMSTVEFFSQVKDRLAENGVMTVNMNMRTDVKNGINDYLSQTICSVFDYVYSVDDRNGTNTVLFASDNDKMTDILQRERVKVKDRDLADFMETLSGNLEKVKGGSLVLTDDKAPVELLGMEAMDRLVTEELAAYKDLIRREGIKGFIESL